MTDFLVLFPLVFLVAVLYSSVGHGGASGYLAVFALLGMATPEVAPVALLLNIVVASMAFAQYFRAGHFSWRMLLPFVVASVPAAFLGGTLEVPREVFSGLLGAALLFSAVRLTAMRNVTYETKEVDSRHLWIFGVPIGALLGFLSGMTGIGGGVFLSPLLLFLGWADIKRTAAISSAFIVLNSVSGLAGQMTKATVNPLESLPLVLVAAAGGFIGSHHGAFRLPKRTVQTVLAVVLVMAGVKLVMKVF